MNIPPSLRSLDLTITRFMADYGVLFLRISVGVVFLWFGFLKFFPNLSPAEDLAIRTTRVLTFGLVPDEVAINVLAAWECLIGIGLLVGRFLRIIILLLFLQMVGAIAPLFIFPNDVFTYVPYAPTLEGQYILKNAIIISAAIVIGGTIRGGRCVAEPGAIKPEARERGKT